MALTMKAARVFKLKCTVSLKKINIKKKLTKRMEQMEIERQVLKCWCKK